ncbi:uncharacterized protein [Elaeis guineensis]|uniref:uncharacterized protein isoform X2 n=1 Tax=Elaeis guineensis var. tenera TaxID=51953 RepID=UPI003C6D4CE7
MASAFLSLILSKAVDLLTKFRRFASPSSSSDPQNGFSEEFNQLERMLQQIRAFLHDAEEREIRDAGVELWLKELKEVAYDLEDVIDRCQYEVLQAQVEERSSREAGRKRKREQEEEVCGFNSTESVLLTKVSIPYGMADEIRKIRMRFDEISKDREALCLREEDGERRVDNTTNPPPTVHLVDHNSVYGRQHEKAKVIELLLSEVERKKIAVVPIVGKGGLGKTTLAQLVYNDPKVQKYFSLKGWICVSADFDVTRLTKAIIESVTGESCSLMELSMLQEHLKMKVGGKRLLLVLDDVWNEQQSRWDSLKLPFVGAEAVGIITTTRNDPVAKIMQTQPPFYLGYLSDDHCWPLLWHVVFGGPVANEKSNLVGIGRQIVKKCRGLPLAVKVIGGLLRYENEDHSWLNVLQSDLWELDENHEILGALKLSYNRMPSYLKPCFMYCSMFPKDHVYTEDKLVKLWMAQGYIQPRDGRSVEDIGKRYFDELHGRSFFDFFKGRLFKMHDMIHHLAEFISKKECHAVVDEKPCDIPFEVRHLYMQGSKIFMKPQSSNKTKALRTLLLSSRYQIVHTTKCPSILQNMQRLRALELDWVTIDELIDSIGNMKHLRYLYIDSGSKFPQSLCSLYNLQILDLTSSRLGELPEGLGNLVNLRYLGLSECKITSLPESVCHLHNLQTLDLKSCSDLAELPGGLGSLTSLRHLRLCESGIKRLPESICQLHNLQTLDLSRCRLLTELHTGMENLIGLCHLDIRGSGVKQLLPWIGRLAKLRWLFAHVNVRSCGVGLLKDLANLECSLCISGLRNMVNIVDAKDVNLQSKDQLQRLKLIWSHGALNYADDVDWDLKLHVSSEKINSAPADEEVEEALLECLQPHSSLTELHIKGYGGANFPRWVGDQSFSESLREISITGCDKLRSISLHNLKSLRELEINNCPQLHVLPEESLPSKLESVYIKDCMQIASVAGLYKLDSLRGLEMSNCPQLHMSPELPLSSKLETLDIRDCMQLASLVGLQNFTCLRRLHIARCPKLQIASSDHLSMIPYDVEIVDCPKMREWCNRQKIMYSQDQVLFADILTISNINEIRNHGVNNFTNLEHLCVRDCVMLDPRTDEWLPSSLQSLILVFCKFPDSLRLHQNLTVLKRLTIKDCMELKLVLGLHHLISLQNLVICDCNELQLLPNEQLPFSLESLVVKGCENLRYLPLLHQNLSSFKELQIMDCPKLRMVAGLNNLSSLQTLRISHCPEFEFLPNEWLPSIPQLVEIAHCPRLKEWCQRHHIQSIECLNSNTRETDNEEFTDNENLERQVMDCEMEDHDQNHDRDPLSDDLVRSPSQ